MCEGALFCTRPDGEPANTEALEITVFREPVQDLDLWRSVSPGAGHETQYE